MHRLHSFGLSPSPCSLSLHLRSSLLFCLLARFFILRLHYFNHSIKSVNTFIIPRGWEPSILLSLCWVIALWQEMMASTEPFICSVVFIRRGHRAPLSLRTRLARPAWCPSYNFALRCLRFCSRSHSPFFVTVYFFIRNVFSFLWPSLSEGCVSL